MSEPAYPVIGPCSPWTTASDVLACCDIGECDTPSVLDDVAELASTTLFEVSGRRFNGICERVLRPYASPCQCWSLIGGSRWVWSYSTAVGIWGWGWFNEGGDRRGCTPLQQITLPGYPVQQVTEVLIDGDVVDPATYRLDNRRDLVRMDDPGPPYVKNYWPGCQNLALEADQPGTFQVSYTWGMAPPQVGVEAAAELACELFKSCQGAECAIPAGATRVTRQGVTIERSLFTHWLDPSTPTGLLYLDLFLRSYWGGGTGRQAAIWSPDIRGYGLRAHP